jgi:DNA-binding NtrC family response regulator
VPGGTETILVVEDDDTVRELSVDALKRLGYQILAASSAEEALGVMDQYSDPIHLLITDVVMPGLSGPELAEILTTCRHGLRVVFTSGYPPPAARHNRADLRPNQVFLQKPYSFRALARAVRELLDRSANNAV